MAAQQRELHSVAKVRRDDGAKCTRDPNYRFAPITTLDHW
nr:hypothetical protein [uncultured bacterium]ART90406.1 hypothetical protein [uncultured bacterium]